MEIPSNSGKKCNRCQAMLPFAEFGVNRALRDGLQATCKPCQRALREDRARASGRVLRPQRPPVPTGMKWCVRCTTIKPVGDFYRANSRSDGLSSYCKQCSHEAVKASERRTRDRNGGQPLQRRDKRVGELWCPDCQEYRPLAEFFRNVSTATGYGNYCREHQTARVVENRNRLHGGSRNYHLKRRYGITVADFQERFEAAGGLCQGCRKAPAVHVDHDHVTKQVRGLLCFNCNQALGNVRDDVAVLLSLVNYLEVFGCNPRMDPFDLSRVRSMAEQLAPSPSGSEQPPLTSSPDEEDSQQG